ncbi:MAG: 2-iminoacetate synthase ThiH [Acidimicrobiales bacterium]
MKVALLGRADAPPRDTAAADLEALDTDRLVRLAHEATAADVEASLARTRRDDSDLAVLLSPAAAEYLEPMAAEAHRASVARFGRVVRLFAPLYLSSECVSTCTYCGFSAANDIVRRTLNPAEIGAEAQILAGRGLRHLLLVSGEHARVVSPDYLAEAVAVTASVVPSVSVEAQVWDADVYSQLVAAGAEGLVVYQETYDQATYSSVHLKGKKRNFHWRLAAPDRAAAGGMRSLGIGALLGLRPDWRAEVVAVGAHARLLMRRWWRCEVSISLPRLRPAAGFSGPGFGEGGSGGGNSGEGSFGSAGVGDTRVGPLDTVRTSGGVDDRAYVQAICALRLALCDVGLTLSTRESPRLREGLLRLGVTAMSAGSRPTPGGYGDAQTTESQFEVSDRRDVSEVAAGLIAAGYDPVWKDTIGPRSPLE